MAREQDPSRRQPPKYCSSGDEPSQIPPGRGLRGLFIEVSIHSGAESQAFRHIHLLFFFIEVSGITFWPGLSNFPGFREAVTPAGASENDSSQGTNILESGTWIPKHRT